MIWRALDALRNPLWTLRSIAGNQLLIAGREERHIVVKVRPYTLLGTGRLRNLWSLANRVLEDQVPGCFVECGCWNGGSGALLARAASRYGRLTWLFDSFEGLPAPSADDVTSWGELGKTGDFVGSETKVREVLQLVGVPESGVIITKGWFEETVAVAATGPIALLHVDVDWHDSAITVLNALFRRVSPGGLLVVDDYGFWRGLRTAVDEFVAAQGGLKIHRAVYPGAWIEKPAH